MTERLHQLCTTFDHPDVSEPFDSLLHREDVMQYGDFVVADGVDIRDLATLEAWLLAKLTVQGIAVDSIRVDLIGRNRVNFALFADPTIYPQLRGVEGLASCVDIDSVHVE